jgi:hypothetical protein
MQIYNNEDLEFFFFDAKMMLSVELISQFNSSRKILASNFDFSFLCQLK